MRKLVTLTLFLLLAFLKMQAQSCFTKNWTGSGVDQMNFYIFKATVNNVDLQIGDEIGIFDGSACVGVGVLTQSPLGGTVYLAIVASNDDVSTPGKDGFTPGNPISYKLCTNGGNTIVSTVVANYTLGSGSFAVSGSVGVELSGTIDIPTAPVIGTITQPTCAVPTGSVVLSSLPASGNWTLTRSPGSVTTTGSGTSITITGLAPSQTYTFTVTNASGNTSVSSGNVVINAVPNAPAAPVVGTITHPTCTVSTGSVVLSGLPATGTWTLTRSPGSVATTGSGTSTTITLLTAGTYTYTVTDVAGCISPSTGNIVINTQPTTPTAPVVGTITQPTCTIATGSVVLSGLPASGTWTLTRSPGGNTTTGTGTSTTISGLAAGTYTYTVTNASTCVSGSSGNVVINAQPATPTAPVVGTITQPTCTVATGSVVLSGLPASGTWTLTRTPGGNTTTGTGTSTTITGLAAGTYTYTVTNAATCVSGSSGNVVINTQPATPTAPVVGTITQPTCAVPTGSVVLSGLPDTGTWTLTRSPGGNTTTGTGTSTTITGLVAGTYTYTVTNASTCVSGSSGNIFINTVPNAPTAPVIGTITQPTCSVSTGSVVLSGLPATGTWTLTRNPGAVATTGSGTSTTITLLATGTYTYTVTDAAGCISPSTGNIVINAQPATPTAPVVGTITQPTCTVATGSVVLSGLPASGTWTLTRTPGGNTTTGTGTSTTISGLVAGTYTYTVTNAATCVSGSSGNVVINAQPATPTAPVVGTITQPTCSVATGSVVLNGLPASGTWTLTRSPGGNTTTGTGTSTTISGLAAGTYTYTVTNALTCVSGSSGNVVINAQPATPSAPVVGTITQPTCTVATGSVVLSGLPASGTWTLTRTPGGITTTGTGTSTTISGLAAGTYTYAVTNAATCVSGSSGNVVINTQPASPTAPVVGTITQPTCAVPTGSVVLSGLPDTGTWTLTRSPGGNTTTGTGTSTTISGLTAGTYTYTVTNASTCISGSSGNVVINAAPNAPTAPVIGTITQPTCSVSTGSVVLSGLPATGTWTLTRNPGAVATTGSGTSTTITLLATGTYTYTVTDAAGCISPSTGNIVINTQPTTPTAPVVGTITQPTCAVPSGSVVLSGLPASGTWTLTRTPGGITTTGTGTSTTISGLATGTYTYTVTNASTCISVSSGNVIINAAPNAPTAPVVGTITQPTCSVSTGSVVLSGLPDTGTWTLTRSPGAIVTSGSGTGTTITLLTAGTYTYTVTDAAGCISPSSGNIVITNQPATPTAPVVGTITQPTCTIATGSVVLSGLPASGTWTLTRTPGGITTTGTGTSITISDLAAETYSFTVTNASTCSSVSSANVIIHTQPTTPTAPAVGTITQPTCAVPTGSVVLSGLPATGNWTLTRTPGGITTTGTGTSTTISGLAAGTYTYTVTNASTCISGSSGNVVINAAPNAPTAPVVGAIAQPTCSVSTGSVELSGLPATGTWTLTRSPGALVTTGSGTSTTITLLTAGTYTYTVADAAGCISPSSGNIVINTQPTTPTAPVVGTITQPTCVVPTGSVVLSGLPASGTWTLTRSPGGATSTGTGTSTTISGLAAGTYTYTVTNAATCVSGSSGNVVINTQPATPTSPVVGTITQPTCAVPSGSVVLSGLPDTGTWTLTRSPGGITSTGTGTSTTISGLAAGTYTYTVTNASACTSGSSGNIVINAAPNAPTAPVIGTITQPTCSVSTGSVVLSGLPATGTWTLTRNPGAVATTGSGTSTTITLLATGTYAYTVTNTAGCISPSSGNIVINTQPATPTAPVVGTITQPSCAVPTGSVVLSGLPSSGTWTLTRTPGGNTTTGTGTSTTISGLATGTYTYTVTNASTCISVSSGNVIINAAPNSPAAPVVGAITQPTCSVSTGSVVLSGLPDTGTWTLTRSPGGITSTGTGTSTTISGLAAGTYTYKVTNASACTSVSSGNVVINAAPNAPTAPVVGTITQPTCTVATGSVVLSGLPASGTWTLTRSPGGATSTGTGTTTTISGLAAGTYTYTVTNAATCVSGSSGNVVINTQPATPTTPVVGMITQPTCAVPTGSVLLSGLPVSGTWTLTRTPGGNTTTGTGTSITISGLTAGTYTYTVTNASTCVSGSSGNVVINAAPNAPTAPVIGTITQPTCTVSTGSVVLSGLPASGTWTLTRSPGNVTTNGTGTSTTITGLATGIFTYSVTNASGCTSPSTGNVVINTVPNAPAAPTVGTITQPTCSIATGSVVLSGLPAAGTWMLTRTPGGTTTSGTGTSTTIAGLSAGTFTYTVTNASGCISSPSANIVINTVPNAPSAPTVGIITQPSCSVATGSVVLNGLPATGTWKLTMTPGGITTNGTGTSKKINGLYSGTYTFVVTNASGCTSSPSANVVIYQQPLMPLIPKIVMIIQPKCQMPTGTVILSDLPGTGTWKLTRTPDGVTTTGSGMRTTVTGLRAGTYTYTVTNAAGCISGASARIVINQGPPTPKAPIIGEITQPGRFSSRGSVVLYGLPSKGIWLLTRIPSGTTIFGTGTTKTINGLAPGTYTFTVTNTYGCTSPESDIVVIRSRHMGLSISTSEFNSLSVSTAVGGGYIVDDSGSDILERGVCWSKSINPTISDSRSLDGSSTGSFTSTISGLTDGETYHIRAYAINNGGIWYGSDIEYHHNPSGRERANPDEIAVFPNPVSDILNIVYKNGKFKTINVLNSSGMLIGKEMAVDELQQLDMTGYKPGFYILEFVKTSGEINRIKVLKKK